MSSVIDRLSLCFYPGNTAVICGNGIAFSQILNARQLPRHRIELDGNLALADFPLGYDENANLIIIGDSSLDVPLDRGAYVTAVWGRFRDLQRTRAIASAIAWR